MMTMRKAQEQLSSLKLQIDTLNKQKKKDGKQKELEMVLATAEAFVKQQELSIKQTRSVTQRLFELAEQLAAKQIETNPKDFMLTQLKQSVMNTDWEEDFHDVMAFDGSNNELLAMNKIQEESKELVTPNKKGYQYSVRNTLSKKNSGGMQESNEDMDDEQFFDAVDELQMQAFTMN